MMRTASISIGRTSFISLDIRTASICMTLRRRRFEVLARL